MPDEDRISLSEVKRLLREMIQIAAIRDQAEDSEQPSPCPLWLALRGACFSPSSVTAAHSLNANTLPSHASGFCSQR